VDGWRVKTLKASREQRSSTDDPHDQQREGKAAPTSPVIILHDGAAPTSPVKHYPLLRWPSAPAANQIDRALFAPLTAFCSNGGRLEGEDVKGQQRAREAAEATTHTASTSPFMMEQHPLLQRPAEGKDQDVKKFYIHPPGGLFFRGGTPC